MPKGIYRRTKPVWNSGKKGLQVAWNKGIPWSDEIKKKLSESHMGQQAWNKGVPNSGFKQGYTPYNKGKTSLDDPRILSRENHPNWVEEWEHLSYEGKHKRIKRRLGKTMACIRCGSEEDIEWSNISGLYKETDSDWQQLCNSCHKTYDKTINNIKWMRKRSATNISGKR